MIASESPKVKNYSCLLFAMPLGISKKAREFVASLKPDDVAREILDGHHITLLWGLHDDDPATIQRALRGTPPVRLKLGKVSCFPATEASDGLDVLKVAVESDDLRRIYARLTATLPNTQTHPSYEPHLTLAYVREGRGQQYADTGPFDGLQLTLNTVTFSSREGQQTPILLDGKRGQARDEYDDLFDHPQITLPGVPLFAVTPETRGGGDRFLWGWANAWVLLPDAVKETLDGFLRAVALYPSMPVREGQEAAGAYSSSAKCCGFAWDSVSLLRDDLLATLILHELAHAYLDATGGPREDEAEVDRLVKEWGGNPEELDRVLSLMT